MNDFVLFGFSAKQVIYNFRLQNAASVAEMVLTTESLVADKPEPAAPAAPAAPEMY